ncbi:hypothetical protein [Endozoicomonas sp. 4G]|uniref:hypothetical protein n=1 Tax=Endozoicomonas sp. 4G TaxID=2872754 RepID=UPI002078B8B0|nr:hypothetical protein [Endozoicomonas sp. 4G]
MMKKRLFTFLLALTTFSPVSTLVHAGLLDNDREEVREERRDDRQDNREEQRDDRRDNRDNRQDHREERRDDRQDNREEQRDDRRDNREERRDDRQDNREDRHDNREDRRDDRQDNREDRRDDRQDRRDDGWNDRRDDRWDGPNVIKKHRVVVAPRKRVIRNNVVVVRNYGNSYYGYGHYRDDNDAYKWLAFTAITLKILDNLNESAQRAHEAAQIKATTAPVGERIIWNDGDASGYVVTTKEGKSASSGLVCREFQQSITVGGRTEDAWGQACLQEDGSWQIVD